MKISQDELQQVYRKMSDGELLAMDPHELTDTARKCRDEEIARRGLDSRAARTTPVEAVEEVPDGPWACAGVFRTVDEAQIVRGLMESAGIPVILERDRGDLLWMGSSPILTSRVLVPESMLDDAHAAIESHATAQELAARAVADPLPVVILARYEDGVFKPLEEVDLEEGEEVEIHLPPKA